MNIKKLVSNFDEPIHAMNKLDIKVVLDCGHENEYAHLTMIQILMAGNDLRCFECNPS